MGTARTAASKTVGLEPQVVADRASWIDRVPIYGVLLFVFLLGCHEMEDPDLWWHLRTGQLIFARGVLPTTDWYTYGDPDARWINIYWFWQVIMAGVQRWAGIPGIVVATSLMGTATFAILLLPANRTRVSPSVAAMLAIVPVMLFADRYPARPESFSFLLLSAALVVCHLASERPSLVWLLPVIQVLWANTHGSFMLGVAVVGCFAAESVVLAIWNRGQTRPRQPTWMVWILVGLACLLACLVNPYGADAFRLVLVLYARLGSGETAQFYQRLAAEFLGFSGYVQQQGLAALKNIRGVLLVGVTLLAVGGFAPLLWKRRGTRVSRWLLTILFAHLGWQSHKNMPFFAIVALATALWNLNDCLANESRRLGRARRLLPVLSGLLLLLLALSVSTNWYYEFAQKDRRPRSQRRFGVGELSEISPHAEAQYLGSPGMPGRVFAVDHCMASAYIFHNGPERKVFLDGRLEVSKRENYERMFDIVDRLVAHDPVAERMLRADVPADATGKREMPALLLSMDDFLGAIENLVNHPRWRPVFYGDAAIVFLYEPDAKRLGIPAVDVEALRIVFYRRALEVKPDSAKNHFFLGKALYRSDPAAAAEHFGRVCEIEPNFSAAHINFAACVASTQPALAERHCRIAISCEPQNAAVFHSYANLLLQQARYAEAILLYRRALQIDPQLELARRNLALAEKQATQRSP